MKTLAQVLINVRVADKATVAAAASVRRAEAEIAAELGGDRPGAAAPSGTEQLVR